MNTEFKYCGFIKTEYVGDFLTITLTDGETKTDLVKVFRAIFDLYNSEVAVSYHISSDRKTELEMLEGWLSHISGGVCAEYETSSYNYSSWTRGTDYDTYLNIGGHDLFNEFEDKQDKWCIIKIKVSKLN